MVVQVDDTSSECLLLVRSSLGLVDELPSESGGHDPEGLGLHSLVSVPGLALLVEVLLDPVEVVGSDVV